jgi:hypothetical protein
MNRLNYPNMPFQYQTGPLFQQIDLNITKTPDSAGRTLPRGAVPTSVNWMRPANTSGGPDQVIVTGIQKSFLGTQQQIIDTRTRQPAVIPGLTGPNNIFVNGTPVAQMTDLLPPDGGSLSDSSVDSLSSLSGFIEERSFADTVITIVASQALNKRGHLVVDFDTLPQPFPGLLPPAVLDPAFDFAPSFVSFLQYDFATLPFLAAGVMLGAQPDLFGNVMPNDAYPCAVYWMGLDTDTVTVSGVGLSSSTARTDLSIVRSLDFPVFVASTDNPNPGPIQEFCTYRTFSWTLTDQLSSFEQVVRIDRPVGPAAPGGTLYVDLARFPDLYRSYILEAPVAPVVEPGPIPVPDF